MKKFFSPLLNLSPFSPVTPTWNDRFVAPTPPSIPDDIDDIPDDLFDFEDEKKKEKPTSSRNLFEKEKKRKKRYWKKK